MTVNSSVSSFRNNGDGVSTVFPVPFYFLDDSHLSIYLFNTLTDAIALQVLGTDYTVTGAGVQPGGSIKMTVPPSATQQVLGLRNVPADQQIDYTPNDKFPAEVTETALDKLTMLIQQVLNGQSNSVRFPIQEFGLNAILPASSDRASGILGFDSSGNVTIIPLPASIGAGDLKNESWTDGVDYTSGTSSSVTLSRSYGSKGNLGTVVMQGVAQDPATYSLTGNTLQFDSVIPVGVSRIYCVGGTTLSIFAPASDSVSDAQISWSTILERNVDTVAALKALDWTRHARAKAAGYLVAGDGGGGSFYKDATDTTSAEDGGNVFIASDGATRIKRILSGAPTVKHFGAVGAGADYTAAFVLAATYAPGGQTMHAADATTIVRADVVDIRIPAGNYTLSSYVGSGGRQIQWHLEPGANVTGYGYLIGKIIREEIRTASLTYGTRDYAVGMSYRTGPIDTEMGAPISGFNVPADIATYPDRDSVAFYADNTAASPLLTDGGAVTYTANSVTLSFTPTAYQLASFRKGMVIDTMHATKYSGFITGWSADGKTINVSAWYLSGSTTAVTPSAGFGVYINPITKIWALNANAILPAGTAVTNQSAGFELGVQAGITSPTEPYLGYPRLWGYDSVNLGSTRGSAAFIARGDWWHGYRAENQVIGYAYKGSNTIMECQDANGVVNFVIGVGGNMEIGSIGVAGTRYMDFHTNGDPTADYNVRVSANGGSGSVNGDGNLVITSGTVSVSGTLYPVSDSSKSLGLATNRWSVIYAASGTISTSDARDKQQFTADLAPELKAWAKVQFGKYKWNDAVQKKGDKARWHFGLIAQTVKDAFESEGLDPFAYGVLCYDEWDDVYEPIMATRKVTETVAIPGRLGSTTQTVEREEEYDTGEKRLVLAAGNRYGVRYEEALALECAYLRSQLLKGN